ncbi:MAG: ATP-binding cassette domain-containing protein [Planctomycetota bacterium]|nr:ATP-binding cassette domain-containing protein [Planctomycetota bacterium]
MSVLALNQVSKAYDSRVVLDSVNFALSGRERVGLVGPNGEGKSTLLRLLAGVEAPDSGLRTSAVGLRIGFITQEPKLEPALRARDAVRRGLGNREELLARIEQLHAALENGSGDVNELGRLEDRLQQLGGHAVEHRVEEMMAHLGILEPDALCGTLSGGEARRVSLAAVLLSEPEVLLLDEPTNHLDVVAIDWLEAYLQASRMPLVMVTHDRYFLDRVVDRIVEVDRGKLYSTSGGYSEFLAAQLTRLTAESNTEQNRLATIRRETAWIRRGAHGRTTKEKARVARYHEMKEQTPLEAREELAFEIPPGPRLGGRIIEARGVGKSFGARALLRDVCLELTAGMRLGIVGANGTGKTTLLRILTGQLAPDAGEVRIGETVRVASIDQMRSVLDENKSVVEEVAGNADGFVKVDGQVQRVAPFLDQFLFPGQRKHTRIRELSGGERNRVQLARLLLQHGNVLALDEPTNDLDLPTLRALEDALCAFAGVVLVVSHDRYFLDRVCTRILFLDGSGNARFHEGDIELLLSELRRPAPEAAPQQASGDEARKARKKAQNELKNLPERIQKLESELHGLDERLADGALYLSADGKAEAAKLAGQRDKLASELDAMYQRWAELEELAADPA